MAKRNKEKPLTLFKKNLGFTLQSLKEQLAELAGQIEKKEAAIKMFRDYLNDYQQNAGMGTSQPIQQVINYQSFLNQIAKTLLIEQEALDSLTDKKDLLTAQIQTHTHQIDTIDQALEQAQKTRLELAENHIEQLNMEQWNHHNPKKYSD